jgi:SAM-dependent methyltransferase
MQRAFSRQYGSLEAWHWWFRGRRRILSAVLEQMLSNDAPARRSRRVLSVGCGPASGLSWLAPHAGAHGHVVGLDIDPDHGRCIPKGMWFVAGSLGAAPWIDGSFDVVLALDVLEHLDDDAAGLREAVRLARPGGLVMLTVPALPSLWGAQDVVSDHRRRYTRRSLFRLCQAAGVGHPRIQYFNTLLFPAVAAVRWGRRVTRRSDRVRSDFDDNRPGLFNDALAWVFGAERYLINNAAAPIGVSLLGAFRTPRREA